MLWRGMLCLDIPLNIYNAIPNERKIAFRDECLAMQAYAVRINEGAVNEEMTVRVEWGNDGEYWSGRLDLAIPWDVWENIPSARKIAFRDEVRAMKAKAVAVGIEGAVMATWHVCHHDEGKACESVQDI